MDGWVKNAINTYVWHRVMEKDKTHKVHLCLRASRLIVRPAVGWQVFVLNEL